jgi:hypothetical protein
LVVALHRRAIVIPNVSEVRPLFQKNAKKVGYQVMTKIGDVGSEQWDVGGGQ